MSDVKLGRPRRAKELSDSMLHIRVTQEGQQLIREKAKEAELTVSEYLRQIIERAIT